MLRLKQQPLEIKWEMSIYCHVSLIMKNKFPTESERKQQKKVFLISLKKFFLRIHF